MRAFVVRYRSPTAFALDLEAAEVRSDVEIRVHLEQEVVGQVVDANGPVAGAPIMGYEYRGLDRFMPDVRTDGEGRFRLSISRASNTLTAQHPRSGGLACAEVAFEEGQAPPPVLFEFPPSGALSGRVLRGGRPMGAGRVELVAEKDGQFYREAASKGRVAFASMEWRPASTG